MNQAGGGARLKVLGKLPDNNPDDGFFLGPSNTKYPLADIYVVEGMTAAFNISQLFMHQHDVYPEYPSDHLILHASKGSQAERIPMYSPTSLSKASVCEIRADVGSKDILLRPGQEVEVAARDADPALMNTFEPRTLTSAHSDGARHEAKRPPDVLETPWQVEYMPENTNPPKFKVRNLSTKN